MKKIPLESTIIGAYKFFFQNILSILGTIWFPTLVFIAVIAGFVAAILPHEWLAGNFQEIGDPTAFLTQRLGLIMMGYFCFLVAAMVTSAMVHVGVMRLALGQTTGTKLFFFSLGAQVWRMIGAFFLAFLIIFGIMLVLMIVFGIVTALLMNVAKDSAVTYGLIQGIMMLAIYAVVIFFEVRLFFFLPAVVVAENKIGIGRSWALSKGNFWRIIVVILAVTVPVYMITVFACYAVVIPAVATVAIHSAQMEPSGDPAQVFAMLKSLLPVLPVVLTILVVGGIAIMGTVMGAIAKAYQAVTAE